MYNMLEKMFHNRPVNEHDLPFVFHRQSTWSDDEGIHHQRRRPSSLTGYELSHHKEKALSKSTIISNPNSISDQVPSSRNSNQLQRRSTIHRLNSSTSNDSNITRIQSNEYTSITDGLTSYFFLSYLIIHRLF
jgi:hypothetical protein